MSLTIPAHARLTVTAQPRNGEPGYRLELDGHQVWIAEADADQVARLMLFPAPAEGSEPETTPAPKPGPEVEVKVTRCEACGQPIREIKQARTKR